MSEYPPLRGLVGRRAESDGARVAVLSSKGTLDYRMLAALVAARREELLAAGVGRGVQVMLALPNSVDYLTWFFAILETGCTVVPFSSLAVPAERAAVSEDGGIGWIVSEPEAALQRTRFEARPVVPDPDRQPDVVARQFSSGSTGRPRTILRTGTNFVADAAHFASTLAIGPDDRFLGVAPFHHAYGGLSFLTAFLVGASVTVLPRFLPGPVLATARRHRPTVFLATPPMISVLGSCALAPGDEEAFRSLRHCVCSAGPLAKAPHDTFVGRYGGAVRIQYGSTETLAATIDLGGGFAEGRVGRPFDGVTVRIFDEDGQPLEPGTPGHVGVHSDAACDGYLDDPVGTSERFRDGYVFPGDRGVVDEGGVLSLLGRSDVINVGGLKVDPVEVCDAIRAALPVSAVEVFEGERGGLPAVFAVVEADPNHVTPFIVVKACRRRLSSYKVPARVHVVERLPRDENGKILRKALDPYRTGTDGPER